MLGYLVAILSFVALSTCRPSASSYLGYYMIPSGGRVHYAAPLGGISLPLTSYPVSYQAAPPVSEPSSTLPPQEVNSSSSTPETEDPQALVIDPESSLPPPQATIPQVQGPIQQIGEFFQSLFPFLRPVPPPPTGGTEGTGGTFYTYPIHPSGFYYNYIPHKSGLANPTYSFGYKIAPGGSQK